MDSIFRAQYPDAIFISWDEWNAVVREYQDSSFQTSQDPSSRGLEEAFGVSPGDVVIYVEAADLLSWSYQGYTTLRLYAGIYLLPAKEDPSDTEATEPTESPETDELSLIYGYKNYYGAGTFSDKNSKIQYRYFYDEDLWQGLRFDRNYRIEETGTDWKQLAAWEDHAGDWPNYEAFGNSSVHQPILVRYVSRAFPYIDMLIEGKWEF